MTERRRDIVVVGAGPVGLSLALGLVRADRSVLVLEKEDGLSEHSRAPIIWPRTQEVLAGLGVMDRFQEEGIVRSRIQLWDVDRERPLLHVPIEELRGETPFPQLLICPQSTTERLLLDGLRQETSAEVRFTAEVTGVRQVGSGVEVDYEHDGTTQTVTGAFVAGCDGAHSRVRDAIGASFEGVTYRMQAALADISFETTQDVRDPRMTRRRGVATGICIDERRWRVIMPRTPGDTTPLDARIEQAVTDLFPTRRYETIWKSEFRLHRRLAEPFVDGRVALAGDAAHLTSPVGGQGMNVGIQDAAALRRALLAALDRDRPQPLHRYATERREALGSGAVRVTDALTRVLLARGGAFLVPALWVFGLVLRIRPIRRAVLRRMALLDDPSRDR